MDTLTTRTIARFAKAVASLERALALSEIPDHGKRDIILLRFELTAEFMSKVLRRMVIESGGEAGLPKDTVRAAHVGSFVGEAETSTLIAVIDDRNRMVHDYSEAFADALCARIKDEYAPAFQNVLKSISGFAS
jgi:nucleotidyltransferase substrate binding protein (TIGR01987 family)